MKYQFKISKFIKDKDIQSMPDHVLIVTLKGSWLYQLQDKIYEFGDNDTIAVDRELNILVWKTWCIPYKE